MRFDRSILLGVTKITTDSGSYNTLSLSGFAGLSDIQSLFQEYRIESVKVTYKLVTSPNTVAAFPTLYTAPQGISTGVPASRDEVLQYQGLKMFQFAPSKTEVSYTYQPKINRVVYRNALSSSYEVSNSPWIATSDMSALFFYSVEWFDRYNTTTNPEHVIEKLLTVRVSARGTK